MKCSRLTMSLPESIRLSMNMEAEELMSEMRKDYGLKLYQRGKLTLSQTAVFCGVDMYELVALLALSGIPVVDYPAGELESEYKHLSKAMK